MYGIKISNYDTFKCIADKCTDTCCAGWDVSVDKNSAKKYMKDPYIKQHLVKIKSSDPTDGYILKMDSNSRCCFLNENSLCDLVI